MLESEDQEVGDKAGTWIEANSKVI